MSFPSPRSWSIRWKGEVHSFAGWQDIEEALARGDLSLMHEVLYADRWWSLKDFLRERPWEEKRVIPEATSPSVGPGPACANEPAAPVSQTPSFWKRWAKHSFSWKNLLALYVGAGVTAGILFLLLSWPVVAILFGAGMIVTAFLLVLKAEHFWSWLGIGLLLGILQVVVMEILLHLRP